MSATITINGRQLGLRHPPYVIAEMSANHGNSLEHAKEVIHAMHEAGADAVKLQTYTAETITLRSDRPEFAIDAGTTWDGRQLHDLYDEAAMPWDWQPPLKDLANELGMDLFSTPFDDTAVDFLEEMQVPAYKIASFELVDLPLIRRVAATGKPLIMSTGMATETEIQEAVQAARTTGAMDIALLKCTSAYPAPPEEANLQTIPALSERFDTVAGLSDHTLGTAVPVAAVALGACLIEKHFTLSRDTPGPDSAFSLEPAEFAQMVEAVRTAHAALGEVRFTPTTKEEASRVFRRSLFVVADVKAGDVFTADNVRSVRPAHGLPPKHIDDILGKQAAMDMTPGTPLTEDCIA